MRVTTERNKATEANRNQTQEENTWKTGKENNFKIRVHDNFLLRLVVYLNILIITNLGNTLFYTLIFLFVCFLSLLQDLKYNKSAHLVGTI